MARIKLNNVSKAEVVKGHGVLAVYQELINLLKKSELFETTIDGNWKKADFNLVHTLNIPYKKIAFSKKVPSITMVHFLPSTLKGSVKIPIIGGMFKGYVKKFYNKSNHLVVVSDDVKEELIKTGIDEKKITLIHNFVSSDYFYELPKAQNMSFRHRLGYADDDFIVIGTGQVQTRKGIDHFLETAKRFETMPNVKFIWVGGVSFKRVSHGAKKYKKIMKQDYKNVTFTGIVDRHEVNSYINMSDVFFSPSYNETFGMSILEGMILKKPAVLRDIPVYERVFTKSYLHGETPDQFATAIKKLMKPEEYKKWSDAAFKISKKYNETEILKQWETLVKQLIN